MSNALAIGAVTAVLRDLLNNGLVDNNLVAGVGDVTVSVLPPDRVPIEGTDARSQLNLFLHQVTPNQGWRNAGLPSRDAQGERISNPPLALDLHYLLTAEGPKPGDAEGALAPLHDDQAPAFRTLQFPRELAALMAGVGHHGADVRPERREAGQQARARAAV